MRILILTPLFYRWKNKAPAHHVSSTEGTDFVEYIDIMINNSRFNQKVFGLYDHVYNPVALLWEGWWLRRWRLRLPVQETQETRAQSLDGEDPWRRAWQPTPVLLPGESHGQRIPGGLWSMGSKRVGHNLVTNTFASEDWTHLAAPEDVKTARVSGVLFSSPVYLSLISRP